MEIKCPYCGNSFNVDNFDKQEIVCPSCKKIIVSESISSSTLMGISNAPQHMPKGLRISLTVLEGKDVGKTVVVDKPDFIIGRENADMVLNDVQVSRKHAVLQLHDRRIVLKDLGSTNGTFIGNRQIKEEELKHLDEISIGGTRLLVTIFETPDTIPDNAGGTILLKEEVSPEQTTRIQRPDDVEYKLPYKQRIYLDIIDGVQKGTTYEFVSGKVVIGRTDGDLIINDPNVSKKHAVIETWSRDTYFIRDLASTNGTYINGQRVTTTKIKNGDIITVGDTRLKLRVENIQ
jgi:pSer/pThr/pTyr-binding forkhead associated (FHA) protein